MARNENVTRVLTDWQDGLGSEDYLRGLVERVLQQVLEAEMTSYLGVEAYERCGGRRGWRNGYKPRVLKTRVGALELMVPQDRDGQLRIPAEVGSDSTGSGTRFCLKRDTIPVGSGPHFGLERNPAPHGTESCPACHGSG